MKGLIVFFAAVALLLVTAIAGYSLTSNDGSNIYVANCAACHGPMSSLTLSNSTSFMVVSANAGRITSAFNHNPAMKASILGTNTSISLGYKPGLKGKLSAAQKNAIVAALQIQHGEDLYNKQVTLNGINYSCSAASCHGPYDNMDPLVVGASFNKIVKAFKQNKKSMQNPMTPLKSKYKLSELHLIAKAVATAVPGNSGTFDGTLAYYTDCMPCHNGPISQVIDPSNTTQTSIDIQNVYKAGSPANGATLIQNAISSNAGAGSATGGMGGLSNLTYPQLQAIASAIQTDVPPANGWSGYSWPGCIDCHQGNQLQ